MSKKPHDRYIKTARGNIVICPPHMLSNPKIELQLPDRFMALTREEVQEVIVNLQGVLDEN